MLQMHLALAPARLLALERMQALHLAVRPVLMGLPAMPTLAPIPILVLVLVLVP